MKADAMRRARQMHSRASPTIPSGDAARAQSSSKHANNNSQQSHGDSQPPLQGYRKDRQDEKSHTEAGDFSLPFIKNISALTESLGLENDQLVILIIIMLLYSQKENFYLIMALLYIAM